MYNISCVSSDGCVNHFRQFCLIQETWRATKRLTGQAKSTFDHRILHYYKGVLLSYEHSYWYNNVNMNPPVWNFKCSTSIVHSRCVSFWDLNIFAGAIQMFITLSFLIDSSWKLQECLLKPLFHLQFLAYRHQNWFYHHFLAFVSAIACLGHFVWYNSAEVMMKLHQSNSDAHIRATNSDLNIFESVPISV